MIFYNFKKNNKKDLSMKQKNRILTRENFKLFINSTIE